MSKADNTPKLLWLDMEFTGLEVGHDLPLEIASVVTDFQLNELDVFQSFIQQDPVVVRQRIEENPWWEGREEHARDLLEGIQSAGEPVDQIESHLIALAANHGIDPIILAGNSIHTDRRWLEKYCPDFSERLHYRMVDVSSFKVVFLGLLSVEYEKHELHRALDDVRESIDELEFLLKSFGNNVVLSALMSHL